MPDIERRDAHLKDGLPPRDRNADVPEHANSGTVLLGGLIAACAVLALIVFGGSGHHRSASNSLNAEPGLTTGAAPAVPSK